jgi:Fe-S oxidoreductase
MSGPNPAVREFAPGCALMIHKPHLAVRLHDILVRNVGPMKMFLTCCHHIPPLARGTEMINVCPGCDRRYRENYAESTTVSLWEVLARGTFFPIPDYAGREMTIIDACPTRTETRVHDAVRELIRRMNITLVEPRRTRTHSTCCGDSLWGVAPEPKVIAAMKKKAATMPTEEIITYCVSCAKAMFIGGRRPRYLVDLLFNEETVPKTYLPSQWHREVDEFIESHR